MHDSGRPWTRRSRTAARPGTPRPRTAARLHYSQPGYARRHNGHSYRAVLQFYPRFLCNRTRCYVDSKLGITYASSDSAIPLTTPRVPAIDADGRVHLISTMFNFLQIKVTRSTGHAGPSHHPVRSALEATIRTISTISSHRIRSQTLSPIEPLDIKKKKNQNQNQIALHHSFLSLVSDDPALDRKSGTSPFGSFRLSRRVLGWRSLSLDETLPNILIFLVRRLITISLLKILILNLFTSSPPSYKRRRNLHHPSSPSHFPPWSSISAPYAESPANPPSTPATTSIAIMPCLYRSSFPTVLPAESRRRTTATTCAGVAHRTRPARHPLPTFESTSMVSRSKFSKQKYVSAMVVV